MSIYEYEVWQDMPGILLYTSQIYKPSAKAQTFALHPVDCAWPLLGIETQPQFCAPFLIRGDDVTR